MNGPIGDSSDAPETFSSSVLLLGLVHVVPKGRKQAEVSGNGDKRENI
jgi:hypothetical protein